jgi:hypothetical protein
MVSPAGLPPAFARSYGGAGQQLEFRTLPLCALSYGGMQKPIVTYPNAMGPKASSAARFLNKSFGAFRKQIGACC